MQERIGVVFVSRRNSLRSVLAEACLAHLDPKRFSAFSCGQPGQIAQAIHPATLKALASTSIPVTQMMPRSWNELTRMGAPRANFVVTMDPSVELLQPRWPGQPDVTMWPFPDLVAGDDAQATSHAAVQMLYSLRRRLELLINRAVARRGPGRRAFRSPGVWRTCSRASRA
ncbi:arsenate-mycothiol transferase ArsC [Variovorax boronicumulans]